ncbi:hypothetical protein OROHE_025919 [Orobanche hederae]
MDAMDGMFIHPCDDDQILVAADTGDLELLQRLRNETGDDETFRRKCEYVRGLEGLTCLHLSAGRGNTEICRFLIDKVKLDINIKNDRGDSPLIFAALKGQFDAANFFILRGADVKSSGYKGTTCLHIAAEKGNKEIMQLLLSKGADIEAQSVSGTPLQCAALCGNIESVGFLLFHGANPNSVSPLSVSPLMGSISSHSYECFELLLEAGADPNMSSCGSSPLALAARENDTCFLRPLLAAGANPNSCTTDLLGPIEHAAEVGNFEGVTILFPVTENIVSCYPDWSILGIKDHHHSEAYKIEKKLRRDGYFQFVYDEGKNAAKEKDYSEAVKWFSEAIYLQPNNETLLSDRSICWENLDEPNFSLHDAEACVMLKPDWPKGHYRAGVAWMLLKHYMKACGSFKTASMLDPDNMEIKKALSLAFKSAILGQAEKNLPNTVYLLAFLVPFCPAFYMTLLNMAKENSSEAMRVLREFLESSDLVRLL